LETKGVLVVGYKTDEFPAFYYGHSGLKLEHSVSTPGSWLRSYVSAMRWRLIKPFWWEIHLLKRWLWKKAK